MASSEPPGSPVSPCKKPRLSPGWEPSVVQGSECAREGGGSECGTSVDSGLSESGATSPFERGSTPQDGEVSGEQSSMPLLGGSGEDGEPPGGQSQQQGGNQERDDLSSLSGFSDMSGHEWKPNMTGKLAWLHRCMARGEDPRLILLDLLPPNSNIPIEMDNVTLWKVLFNLLSEPPRREKLEGVNTLGDCVELIRKSKNIIVLTGAGVSVSCGIPDFRSKDGVYARLAVDFPDLPDPQAMFDIHYFRKDPRPFFKFAREIYPGQFAPSPCHRFIRCLETHESLLRNYTQNIDTLEQVSGIESVIQCHGSFATATCALCKHKVEADSIREDIFSQNIPLCPICPKPDLEQLFKLKEIALKVVESESNNDACDDNEESSQSEPVAGSSRSIGYEEKPKLNLQSSLFAGVPIMKPDIVFFGEGLSDDFHHAITSDKSRCDLLIVIGSSLKVRPVALIPSSLGAEVPQILINREPLPHCVFDCELLGDCDKIINQLCNMLGEGWSPGVSSSPLIEHLGIPPPTLQEKHERTTTTINESSTIRADASIEENKLDESDSVAGTSKIDKVCNETKEDGPWKTKPSLAECIPQGHFLFLPPARYVFPGAEVAMDSSDDEDDMDSLPEGEESNDEGDCSDEDEIEANVPNGSPADSALLTPVTES